MKVYMFIIPSYPSICIGPEKPYYSPTYGSSWKTHCGNFGITKSRHPEIFDYLISKYNIPNDDQPAIEIEL